MSQQRLSNLISRPDPLEVRCLGFPICCLSFLKCFRILCRLVCPLNVQKGTVFLQSQDILLRFGRCTVYLRWNIESWKSRSQVLKDGILEVSQSPYGAPVLFVPKPNGRGLRLCVDYRALNSITVKNRCTIPRIDDLLDAVAGSQYFTSLDLTSSYHQILISEEDRPKTAFMTPFGHFQFKVLIEGLTNAPATFQTVMNSIFHPYIGKFVVVYIDDILIFSKTEAEHQAHVRLVL